VFVNRVWMHHFGKGLVRTPSNFGALGERPTHPDLLDHLATKFVRSGWSVKELHRAIVLSAAYRQQSRVEGRGQEVDPDNKLLWRMNRRRLEVEAWRDSVLAVSGQLDRTLGGPSKELADPANRRRTFYAAISRHELNPLLRLFDYPDPNLTCDERPVTTVPLQQLFVLNGEFMVQSARTLSALLAASGADASGRIEQAFLLLYGRSPTAQERKLALDFVADNAAKDDRLSRWEQLAQVLLAANESMFVD
jgi:hypothetical protein